MAKRRGVRTPDPASKTDYPVGYGRPPKHTQFKPGQSGNPAGRPKGLHNFKTDVLETLAMPLKVKEGGHARTVSTQAGTLLMTRQKAIKGDRHSLAQMMELAQRYNPDAGETVTDQALSADDEAIWEAIKNDILAGGQTETPKATDEPNDPAAQVRRRKKSNE